MQTQKARILMNNTDTFLLPLEPKSDEESVLNVFSADNINKSIDKEIGGSAINSTTIMVFLESWIGGVRVECKFSVSRTKSQKATVKTDKHNTVLYDKHEPHVTYFKHVENESNCSLPEFSYKFFTWLYLRYCNRFEMVYPNLSRMLLTLLKK